MNCHLPRLWQCFFSLNVRMFKCSNVKFSAAHFSCIIIYNTMRFVIAQRMFGHNKSSISSTTCLFAIASPVQYSVEQINDIFFVCFKDRKSYRILYVCYVFCVCSSQHFRWHSICCYAQCLFNRSIGIRMYFNGILIRKRNKSFIESRKILSNDSFCDKLCYVYLKLINYIRYSEVNFI